jgi:hypothetical protein
MNSFIEKNKKLLRFYHAALRLAGWLLLTLGLSSYVIVFILARNLGSQSFVATVINLPLKSLHLILFGILGLGIAQLILYLFDHSQKTGFILRHGSKFLYAYIILIFAVMIVRYVLTVKVLIDSDVENPNLIFFSTSITSFALFAAKALILIGLAQFLKRIKPIIEEHKSLV